eukprot:TRINITY_DN8735_c0_g1_i1.p1 TRINITY_DN8735_c0_g1~~TRINITY_DN8735_c0_g1_i1.p1  ORF type:complete len:370 (+),score=54.85 TRINITY_DN8735_c0_g1_i1:52-1161(+)
MKLVFLGTASAFPTPNRGVSCTALQLDDGQIWLFDCGEGSQIQIQKSTLKPGKVSKIFITHLHGDHLFGLQGLLCTLANGQDTDALKKKTVEIYGPVGLRKYIATTLSLSRSPLSFRISVIEIIPRDDQYPDNWNDWKVEHEIDSALKLPQESQYRRECYDEELKGWKLLDDAKGFVVHAAALEHRIPSFGFQILEPSSPGQLDVKKLQETGLKPGPAYSKLKNGIPVHHDGIDLQPTDFIGPSIPGREIIIFGDTRNSDEILNFAKNPDAFVHEATMENSLEEKCKEYGHSTPNMAADIALRSRANQLIIFHVSPRYKPIGEELSDGDVSANILLQEAVEYLKSKNSEMEVKVAQDFMEVDIPRRKPT